ncbi:ATP-sensitive inward rectifier potassium channel 12 [Amphibalanus amphitrite]|uniref:ATP-sensitive inward rectifier potassium channel 12 n=2 Tax=Amphibalanus amphitrite TaxID=1232801 RepID=A0A6A4VHT3_AMPAM|nr:ATP-sensitive inward rectifier potassium channel 11-like isoform X1 [Amphibalanus amphitrite]XP_043211310.1 ATP-sensitive inward rectifier potassium channel 11-like isoform X1 [Amphibalanus amphitrite]KAF0294016.1 ATP-sensitive inward rectifier potassium channel 12 [Amphibalanus amphitrite]
MPAALDPASGAPMPGSVLRPDPEESDRPDRQLLHSPGPEPEPETWEPAGLPGDVKHVPFGGLTLASAVNGVTYQHTLGALDNRVRNRMSTRKLRKRVVFKNGDLNVVQGHLSKRRRRYLADIVTTLVDIKWRWTLLVFSLSFLLSWLLFAVLWWLIMVAHGDFEPQNRANPDFTPCVNSVEDFTGSFLYSIETQHTIGYGTRAITEQCPEAITLLCVQSIVGLMIQALMVSVVFAKLARPKKCAQTLLFSRNAVICQRDGRLCLMFRVGNMRTSSLIGASARGQIIRKRVTREGETLQFDMVELNLGPDDGQDSIFFIWPLNVVHTIDERSPFYHMSAEDLLHKERFEIVVILEGTTESTAMTTQARSSFIPSEILWGHRFEPIIDFKRDTGKYEVDYSRFNSTYQVDTPLCSAAELDQFRKIQAETANGAGDAAVESRANTANAGFNNFDLLRLGAVQEPSAAPGDDVEAAQRT